MNRADKNWAQCYEKKYHKIKIKISWSPCHHSKIFSERFNQFLTQKNDLKSRNFEMFQEVVHNFGKSDDDMI